VPADRELSPSSYIAILRGRAGLVAAITGVCVAVAAVVVLGGAREYKANADLLVTPVSSGDDTFVGVQVLRDSGVAPSSNVLTVARLIKTPATAAIVSAQPGARGSASTLLGSISVSPLSQTSMVAITATASTPGRAAAIANAFARATIARRTIVFQAALQPIVGRLQGEADALGKTAGGSAAASAIQGRLAVLKPLIGASDPTLELVDSAQPPAAPASRHTFLALVAALVGGLIIGLAVAFLRELTDRRVRREHELASVLDAPVLARVGARSRYASATAYRDLRARLFDAEVAPTVVAVTEARDGDGATESAVELARSLASAGRRVALLDCDFDRPRVAGAFGVDAPENGFGAVFGDDGFDCALVAAPGFGTRLHLALPTIESGRDRRLARLEPNDIRRVVARLQEIADVVVIDTAPLARSSDALLVGRAASAALVAVRLGSTSLPALNELVRSSDEVGIPVAGVVVSSSTAKGRRLSGAWRRRLGAMLHAAASSLATGRAADTALAAAPGEKRLRPQQQPAESTAARPR
jgi:capsular polysaccharide biosynthesis protein